MSRNPRRFAKSTRLIVSVEAGRLMSQGQHHGHRSRRVCPTGQQLLLRPAQWGAS